MFEKGFDKALLQRWALNELGSSDVDVVLSQEDIDFASMEVLEFFNRYKAPIGTTNITTHAGMQKYKLPIYGNGVIDVTPKFANAGLNCQNTPIRFCGFDVAEYHIARQGLFTSLREFGAEWDYKITMENGESYLYIHPTPQNTYSVSIQYKNSFDDFYQFSQKDRLTAKNYLVALLKIRLGHKYRAAGNNIEGANNQLQLYGEEYLREGFEELESIKENEYNQTCAKIPPIMG